MAKTVKMTESEYRDCQEPIYLLEFLRSRYAYPNEEASNRKLRLFACACCRRIWHLLPNVRSRRAVELRERFADGLVTQEEMEAVRKALVFNDSSARRRSIRSAVAGAAAGSFNSYEIIRGLAPSAQADEARAHCDLLRDIYGNPFHPAMLNESWLTWRGGIVVQLARDVYEDQAFDRLPIVADALEEAGCMDQHIFEHCRTPGVHVKGCWVVDLLLGNAARPGSWIHRL